LSIFEILTVRSVLALVILLSLAALWPELRAGLRPRQMRLNLLRNTIHFASQFAWALSLTLLPFATVFVLEFSMPVWVAILAVIFLGERVTSGRIGVIVLGLIGGLVIWRPGVEAFRPASLLVLVAAFGFATFNILTKKLTATESTFGIVFWMNAMQLPMGLAGSDLFFFLKLGVAQLPWLLGVIAGLSAHYCLAKAFRSGGATLARFFAAAADCDHRPAVLRRSPRSFRVRRRITDGCRHFVESAFRDEAVCPFTTGRNPITCGFPAASLRLDRASESSTLALYSSASCFPR
jgi:drug/metabolite transporter (DMT)-like permease